MLCCYFAAAAAAATHTAATAAGQRHGCWIKFAICPRPSSAAVSLLVSFGAAAAPVLRPRLPLCPARTASHNTLLWCGSSCLHAPQTGGLSRHCGLEDWRRCLWERHSHCERGGRGGLQRGLDDKSRDTGILRARLGLEGLEERLERRLRLGGARDPRHHGRQSCTHLTGCRRGKQSGVESLEGRDQAEFGTRFGTEPLCATLNAITAMTSGVEIDSLCNRRRGPSLLPTGQRLGLGRLDPLDSRTSDRGLPLRLEQLHSLQS